MESKNNKKIPFIIGLSVIVIICLLAAALLANSDGRKVKKYLKNANEYLLELDYDNAILAFEQVLDIDPENVEAYRGVINAYMQKGTLEKALKYAEKAYKKTKLEEFNEQIETISMMINDHENETTEDIVESDNDIGNATETDNVNVSEAESTEESSEGTRYVLSKELHYSNNSLTNIIEYTLDEAGNVVSRYDSSRDKHFFNEYDEEGRLIKEWIYDETDGYEECQYTYDEKGRRIHKTVRFESENEHYNYESYSYNEKGLLSTIRNSFYYFKYELRYDDKNNLIRKDCLSLVGGNEIDPITTIYKYDSDGRLIEEITASSDSDSYVSRSYKYDGNTITEYAHGYEPDSITGTTTYTYDAYGNVMKIVTGSPSLADIGAYYTTEILYEYKEFH